MTLGYCPVAHWGVPSDRGRGQVHACILYAAVCIKRCADNKMHGVNVHA